MNERFVYLYVIARLYQSQPAYPVKIGVSDNPDKRVRSLQTASPFRLITFCCFRLPSREIAEDLESAIHESLEEHRLNGEWFHVHPTKAALTICAALHQLAELAPHKRSLILDFTGALETERLLLQSVPESTK